MRNRKEPRGIPIKPILRPGLLIYSPVVLILGTISGISMCLMLAM